MPLKAVQSLFIAVVLVISGCTDEGASNDSANTPAADYVFTNTKVYTVDEQQLWAEAVAVSGRQIVYVGDTGGADTHVGATTRVIDLQGKLLLPGMIDTHMHPGIFGLASSLGVNLIANRTVDAYQQAIAEYAQENPDAAVIAGFGFLPQVFGPKGPKKELIDAVVSDRPVFIISGHGHSAWANSKALEVLKINKDTPDPHPGAHFYRRDAEGNPTGHLVEGAAFWSHLDTLGIGLPQDFKTGYAATLSLFSQVGITALFDAGTPGVQENAFKALTELEQEGKLPLRYHASFYVIDEADSKVAVETIQRFREQYTTELLRPTTIKISNDGQSPEPGVSHLLFTGEQLAPIFTEIAQAGEDVMIHATVQRTVKETLDGIVAAREAHPDSGSRFIITHVDLMHSSDLERFVSHDIIANVQPMAAQVGFFWGQQFPPDTLVAPWNSLTSQGVVVSASSDFPACGAPIWGCTPFYSIEVGVTRQAPGNKDDKILAPESERMTVGQLVKAHTLQSAYQVRREDDLGSIEVGKLADLIVVDQNIFEIDPNEIHKTKVLLTMMNGKLVHEQLKQ